MHELPIVQQILSTVLKHAAGQNVAKIAIIHLEVGELSDLENEWIQRYFDYLSKETPAEGARLEIQRIPIRLQCGKCSKIYVVEKNNIDKAVCPDCGEKGGSLVSGREYYIKSMEVM